MRSTRGWTNTVTNSTGTVYRNVKVFSHTGTWGLDGINPVSSKGFLIEDCFIRTRDDCIAVKANGNPDNFDLSCKDVTVRGCLLESRPFLGQGNCLLKGKSISLQR